MDLDAGRAVFAGWLPAVPALLLVGGTFGTAWLVRDLTAPPHAPAVHYPDSGSRPIVRAIEIYRVRHAVAVRRGGDALDHARPLTPKGRSRFEREVRGLYGPGVRFDRVYHSPWTRAVQTAEFLSPVTTGERRHRRPGARPTTRSSVRSRARASPSSVTSAG